LLICLALLPRNLIPKIQGGLPGTEHNGEMYADYLIEMTTSGCESDFGRIFEVTAQGELVWEYVNPYFNEGPNGLNNRVFRAYRYSADEIDRAKAT
jgi:hypothetical protein